MDLQLRDKLALITDSTVGIRCAIARTLAREGARIIVNGRTEEAVNTATGKLKASGGDVFGFAGAPATAEAADEIARRHPDVEILADNLLTRTDPAAAVVTATRISLRRPSASRRKPRGRHSQPARPRSNQRRHIVMGAPNS